eukprot:CAMPEP_0118722560 /NCGR_PEP_ID=MMETSP0800-20121206/31486_1 /TAXON_ID=210618 ORGANISM="Striatella unipunctata, Strain CCMP2910" /NCGR_SAMPLE_ID=MMETSP0800 /ASSEMBLY_ACC=CAM_ASM_000638 /LENGTH=430 /DNA_ID=CAMNT_0006630829 /DNA_START=10 /DNA_END=1303 /DNA_ORIENTATION=+
MSAEPSMSAQPSISAVPTISAEPSVSNEPTSSSPPSMTPSVAPSVLAECGADSLDTAGAIVIATVTSAEDLADPTSAQSLAAAFLQADTSDLSSPETTTTELFLERYAAASFLISAGLTDNAQAGVDTCSWTGITCDTSDRVTAIVIDSFTGGSTLPSELGSMEGLTQLFATNGNFVGSVPDTLFTETMTVIDLSNNALNGSLPENVCNATGLVDLIVTGNDLTGNIAENFFCLTTLEFLDLSSNSMSGEIPTQLGLLSNLLILDLFDNFFSGQIPTEIVNPGMLYLDISFQFDLFGAIPTEIGSAASLTLLSLSQNFLDSALPTEFFNLGALTYLDLFDNALSGTLPTQVGTLGSMQSLFLSFNSFEGTLPTELGNLINIATFTAHGNLFNGSITDGVHPFCDLSFVEFTLNCLLVSPNCATQCFVTDV